MKDSSQSSSLFICHECDALQNVPVLAAGAAANCICCGSRLFKNPKGGLATPLAFILSSFIFFLIANLYPVMTMEIAGIERTVTLTGSALIFIEQGSPELAIVVLLSSVLIPGFSILGLLYVLLSIRYRSNWPYTRKILSWVSRLLPWGMMDVFLLGILVALVKLVALADIVLGTGFYAFVGLIFLYAAAISSIEPHMLWESLNKKTTRLSGAINEQ